MVKGILLHTLWLFLNSTIDKIELNVGFMLIDNKKDAHRGS